MLPDNRIRLSPTKIDFDNDVGTTGQSHDDYPAPGAQARFDHMRMFLIGLLSNQSSFSAPVEYRDGSLWFDLNDLSIKIRAGGAWQPLSNSIKVGDTTLEEWVAGVNQTVIGLSPEILFSGLCTINNTTSIPIPVAVQGNISSTSRIFLYINGSLTNLAQASFVGSPPTTINLSGISLNSGDQFIVNIRSIADQNYISTPFIIS